MAGPTYHARKGTAEGGGRIYTLHISLSFIDDERIAAVLLLRRCLALIMGVAHYSYLEHGPVSERAMLSIRMESGTWTYAFDRAKATKLPLQIRFLGVVVEPADEQRFEGITAHLGIIRRVVCCESQPISLQVRGRGLRRPGLRKDPLRRKIPLTLRKTFGEMLFQPISFLEPQPVSTLEPALCRLVVIGFL